MRVSLNWVKKYVDLPKEITNKQLSYDLTMRTVEVEDVIDTSLKFHDIIVGEINKYHEWPWSICCFSREVKLEITRQEIRYNVLAEESL